MTIRTIHLDIYTFYRERPACPRKTPPRRTDHPYPTLIPRTQTLPKPTPTQAPAIHIKPTRAPQGAVFAFLIARGRSCINKPLRSNSFPETPPTPQEPSATARSSEPATPTQSSVRGFGTIQSYIYARDYVMVFP